MGPRMIIEQHDSDSDRHRWRGEMTGCPRLDREDSSSNDRWRRASKVWWKKLKREFAGIIKDGEEQVAELAHHCAVSSKRVMVAFDSLTPDSSRLESLDRRRQGQTESATGVL